MTKTKKNKILKLKSKKNIKLKHKKSKLLKRKKSKFSRNKKGGFVDSNKLIAIGHKFSVFDNNKKEDTFEFKDSDFFLSDTYDYVIPKKKLGSGNFGIVFLGNYIRHNYIEKPSSSGSKYDISVIMPVVIKTAITDEYYKLPGRSNLDLLNELMLFKEIEKKKIYPANLVQRINRNNTSIRFSPTHPYNIDPCDNTYHNMPCILLEYMELGSLEDYLKHLKKNRIEYENYKYFLEKIKICSDVAKGMAFLHNNNIMHFDLAPRNILLKKDFENNIIAKIADFGKACIYNRQKKKIDIISLDRFCRDKELNENEFKRCNLNLDVSIHPPDNVYFKLFTKYHDKEFKKKRVLVETQPHKIIAQVKDSKNKIKNSQELTTGLKTDYETEIKTLKKQLEEKDTKLKTKLEEKDTVLKKQLEEKETELKTKLEEKETELKTKLEKTIK